MWRYAAYLGAVLGLGFLVESAVMVALARFPLPARFGPLLPLVDAGLLAALLAAPLWIFVLRPIARAEARLRDAHRRLAGLLDALPDAVLMVDPDGRVSGGNRCARRLFGGRGGRIEGIPVRRLLPGLPPCARAGLTWTGEARPGDGTLAGVPVEVSLAHAPLAERPTLLAVVRNLSGTKKLEWELRVRAAALEASANAVLIANADGTIEWVNRAFTELTGYSREEAVGRTPAILRSGRHDPAFYEDLWTTILSGRVWRGEIVNRRKDGTLYTEQMTITPVLDDEGRPARFIAIKQDVTEERRKREQLERAREEAEAAARAKAAFLANMSHEIRTPLNAVIGLTDLLLRTKLDREQEESLELIRSNGETLLAIINDILDLSKIEAGRMPVNKEPCDIVECVEEVLAMLAARAQENGVEVVPVEIAGEVPRIVSCDRLRLRQILFNLVGNAAKFTLEGEIAVRIGLLQRDRAYLEFAVQDTGLGIAREHQEAIFESFRQADGSIAHRFGGTGLGLAICRRLVDLLGGTIGVESAPGRGSTFRFTIPLEPAPDQPSHPVAPSALKGLALLLVEPHSRSRSVLQQELLRWGMAVEAVAGLNEAHDRLAKGGIYPLVLAAAPPRGDGGALRTLASRLPSAESLIVMTPRTRLRDPELAGFTLVAKPVRFAPLAALLAARVGGSAPPRRRLLPVSGGSDSRRLKVLVAEDNPVNRKVAVKLLEQLGHRADTVCDGAAAVEAARRERYDVVLMDLQMPNMDGLEAARRIRALGLRPRIYALTAHALDEARQACLAAGMDGVLLKPIGVDALAEALAARPAVAAES
ncbi:MAG: response regulator [Acidobacteria bacterium]|nr:MAG: response regulator [Acidobacteriota bacterium]